MTPEEKKQQRIRKKLAKNAEAEIRKETLPDWPVWDIFQKSNPNLVLMRYYLKKNH